MNIYIYFDFGFTFFLMQINVKYDLCWNFDCLTHGVSQLWWPAVTLCPAFSREDRSGVWLVSMYLPWSPAGHLQRDQNLCLSPTSVLQLWEMCVWQNHIEFAVNNARRCGPQRVHGRRWSKLNTLNRSFRASLFKKRFTHSIQRVHGVCLLLESSSHSNKIRTFLQPSSHQTKPILN